MMCYAVDPHTYHASSEFYYSLGQPLGSAEQILILTEFVETIYVAVYIVCRP